MTGAFLYADAVTLQAGSASEWLDRDSCSKIAWRGMTLESASLRKW